jgi:hypothetical protein
MYIVDIDQLQNYLDITIKRDTERDEFLSLDPVFNGVGQSNSLVNVVPALRNANITTENSKMINLIHHQLITLNRLILMLALWVMERVTET